MQKVTESKLVQCLTDAGYTSKNIAALLEQPPTRQRAMIEEYRCTLLDELHCTTHKLECLDYLRYQYLNPTNQTGKEMCF